jgi:hypothetical protein
VLQLGTLAPPADHGLGMSGQASQGSTPCDYDTKNDHTWEKSLAQQTEQGFDPNHQWL